MPGAGVYVATLIGAVKEAVDGKFGVESVSPDEDFWVAAPALVPRHLWSHAGLSGADWDLMDELHTQNEEDSDARLQAKYRNIWDDESGGGVSLWQRSAHGRHRRRQFSETSDGHDSSLSTHESKEQTAAHRKSHHENSRMKGHGTKHSLISWLFGRAPPPPPPPKQPPNPDPKGMNKTMHQTKAPWHLPFASSNVTIKSGGVYHYNATEGRGGEYSVK